MKAEQLWQELTARGFQFELVAPDRLVVVHPFGAMEERTRALIREHKTALLFLLRPFRETLDPSSDPMVAMPADRSTEPCTANAQPLPVAEVRSAAPRRPPASDQEISRIRAWLDYIGELNLATIAEVLDRCHTDPEALGYYLGRSAEVPGIPLGLDDDRIACRTCTNLDTDGRSLAAARGELVGTARRYLPPPDRLQRCEEYQPQPGQADPRLDRERWPFLAGEGVQSNAPGTSETVERIDLTRGV